MVEFIPGFTGEQQEYTVDWSTAMTTHTHTQLKGELASRQEVGSDWGTGETGGTYQTGAVRNHSDTSTCRNNPCLHQTHLYPT